MRKLITLCPIVVNSLGWYGNTIQTYFQYAAGTLELYYQGEVDIQ